METPGFDYDLLVRPLEPRMMRAIWRIVRQREAAEDALQDALTVVWRKRKAVARHPKPEALILRIAIFSAYDALRKMRRRSRHEVPAGTSEPPRKPPRPDTQPVEDRELREAVLAAISRLPRRQATAVLLSIVEERSYEEIARGMGCSESTVRVHVMRGRAGLIRLLAAATPGSPVGPDRDTKEAEA